MKIAIAQTEPHRGNVSKNIEDHVGYIDRAAEVSADMIIFPELSLTGYEPSLANDLAISEEDSRLDIFSSLSDRFGMMIATGLPIRKEAGVFIGMVIFRPDQERFLYTKQFLHEDEEPFFISERCDCTIAFKDCKLALAICYEISVKEHTNLCFEHDIDVYVASVAKTHGGVEGAHEFLRGIAKVHNVPVIISNAVGMSEEGLCMGSSTIWNGAGEVVSYLDEGNTGLLIYDIGKNTTEKLL